MRISLGGKIGIVFLIFFIELFSFMFAYSTVFRQYEHYMHELHEEIEHLDTVKSLQLALAQVVMPVNDYLIVGGDPNEPENFKILSRKVEDLFEKLDKLEIDSPKEKETFNHIKENFFQIKDIVAKIFSLSNPIGNQESGRLMEKADKISYDSIVGAEMFHQSIHHHLEEIQAAGDKTKSLLNRIVMIGLSFNIILVVVVLILFRHTVSLPISNLRDAAFNMGRGNLRQSIKTGSGDEIGDLADEFNRMAAKLRDSHATLEQKVVERTESLQKEINERKQAENELKKMKDHLDNIIESSSDAIVITDSKGYLTRVNKFFLELLGYRKEEVTGKHIAELLPVEEGIFESNTGEVVKINEKFLSGAKKMLSRLFEEGKIINWESCFVRKDGKLVPVEENIVILYNKQGGRTGAVAIIRDITEREKAEKEIKEARDFLESVIESSKDAIIISNEKGNILSLNTAIERISDFKKGELIGKHSSVLTVKDKETRKKIIEKTAELFEKGSSTYESRQIKDGKYIDVECSSSMIKDDKGNYIAGITIIRDITERKEMEQKLFQSEKLRSLGELAGGVAHDFNNVLAAILGRAQLLKMSADLPPGKQERRKFMKEMKTSLEIIEDAARDGAETVRRIQEFSRSRDEDRHFTTIDLNEIIARSLEFTRARWKSNAESKGIKIKIQKELSPLPLAEGSASELREVFTNIINNTLDAMPQGGTVKIKTFKEDGQISIKIEDTGVGIPKAIRDRIFDPFFTTKGPQSSGLGMSVSYGIINRHRGTITVDSIEGKGTTFMIKLPVAEKTEEEKTKVISGEQMKASILVIEDEEQVRNLLSAILTKGGHEVEAVSNGPQGIEVFGIKAFDLVFTDLGMPEMSGWQVAEKIKSIDGRMPVILISGWDIKLKESEMREHWVDLIVHKPFEVDQVLRSVQEGMVLRDSFKAV